MNEDKALAIIEHLADISRFLERIAKAQEAQAEAVKIGGPFSVIGQGLRNLADAVNRNTTLGGTR
jgi:hypothetical protein